MRETIHVLADEGSLVAATFDKRLIHKAVMFNVARVHGNPVVGMCETIVQHFRPCAHLNAAQIVESMR